MLIRLELIFYKRVIGMAKIIFNKLGRDMEYTGVYKQFLNGLGDQQFNIISKAIDELLN